MKKKRGGLEKKIIVISLSLSLLPLMFMSYLSYSIVDGQYSQMSQNLMEYNERIQNESMENMTRMLNSYMYREAKSISEPIEEHLMECRELVDTEADYMEYLLNQDANLSGIASYSQNETPPGTFYSQSYGQNISLSASVYHLAPHTDPYNTSTPPVNYSSVQDDINTTALMDPLWSSIYARFYNRSDFPLLWFYISTESGVHRSYPWHTGYTDCFDGRTREWYINATGNTSFSSIYYGVSGGGLQISVNRAIYRNGQKYGVVAADISLSSLANCSSSPALTDRCFIMGSKGELISHPDLAPYLDSLMKEENLTWRDHIPPVSIYDLEQTNDAFNRTMGNITRTGSGQELCACPDGNYYITYVPVEGTGWTTVVLVKEEAINAMKIPHLISMNAFSNYMDSSLTELRTQMLLTIVLLSAFMAIIGTAMAFILADYSLSPIRALKNEVEQVSKDIDHPVKPIGKYELAELSRSFEIMRRQLKADMEELEEKNRITEKMNRHLTELQNELIVKSETIKHLYREAFDAAETRKATLILLAHELRTPLTTIYGSLKLLQRELGDSCMNDKAKKWFRAMELATNQLTELINDALLLLELKQKKYQILPEEFAIEDMIEDIRKGVPELENRGQTLKSELRVRNMVADRSLLTRAMIKIVENASEYSPEQTEIEITAESQAGGVYIKVTDHGQGIVEEEKEGIFKFLYEKNEDLRHKNGKKAMGLALVKLIIDAHRGRIWIESTRGTGTSVHIWIKQPLVQD